MPRLLAAGPANARALADLSCWCVVATSPDVGRALWQLPISAELTTDACGYGWGGLLNRLVTARGFFSLKTQASHITVKELLAILYSLRSFPRLRGSGIVRFPVESFVNVHVLHAMRSRLPALMYVVRELHWEKHKRQLRAEA